MARLLMKLKKYHSETLILCVEEANKKEQSFLEEKRKEEEKKRLKSEIHRKTVEDEVNDITF